MYVCFCCPKELCIVNSLKRQHCVSVFARPPHSSRPLSRRCHARPSAACTYRPWVLGKVTWHHLRVTTVILHSLPHTCSVRRVSRAALDFQYSISSWVRLWAPTPCLRPRVVRLHPQLLTLVQQVPDTIHPGSQVAFKPV